MCLQPTDCRSVERQVNGRRISEIACLECAECRDPGRFALDGKEKNRRMVPFSFELRKAL